MWRCVSAVKHPGLSLHLVALATLPRPLTLAHRTTQVKPLHSKVCTERHYLPCAAGGEKPAWPNDADELRRGALLCIPGALVCSHDNTVVLASMKTSGLLEAGTGNAVFSLHAARSKDYGS